MRHSRDFGIFWLSSTISLFGSQVTLLALPLTAAVGLNASPAQMGLLRAAELAPFLLLGLFAGVWVDRHRRRPILVAAALVRALLLASIPVTAFAGRLTMAQLYVVSLLVGTMAVFGDVAAQAFLPTLVGRDRLIDGNSKLEASAATAQVGGPALAGVLIQLVSPPVAIAADAVSFAVSALLLGTIRHPEARPVQGPQGAWTGIGEGLSAVLGHPLLRALTLASSTLNFFFNLLLAVLVLYLSRDLALDAATIGVVFASVGIGGLCGAVIARAVVRRIGLGAALVAASVIAGSGGLFVPLAGGVPAGLVLVVLLSGGLLFGGGLLLWNVNVVSLRQALTPDRLQGRVNATARFLSWGSMPLGALLGGVLGEWLGLRSTIAIAAVGMLIPCLWVICSPTRTLPDHPCPSWTPDDV